MSNLEIREMEKKIKLSKEITIWKILYLKILLRKLS